MIAVDQLEEIIESGDVDQLRVFLRESLRANRANIPDELKVLPRWLVWSVTKISKEKFDKIPHYPTTGAKRYGTQGSPEDIARLGTYDEAWEAFSKGERFAGIGFAMVAEDGLIAFDGDRAISKEFLDLTNETYAERSPSGSGVRAFWQGEFERFQNQDAGVEVFPQGQFVTVTGNIIANLANDLGLGITPLDDAKREMLEMWRPTKASATSAPKPKAPAAQPDGERNFFRKVNDAAMADFDSWVPELFPAAEAYKGGYRVSSEALGRDLEESISIVPEGIKDFGEHDMGDVRGGKRTPIDLVMAWQEDVKTAKQGAFWLCTMMGVNPSAYGWVDRSLSNDVEVALMQHPTQDNVALIFRNQMAGRMLYAHAHASWYEWDGIRWNKEQTDKAFDFARTLARNVNREGKASISSASFCSGVETFCRSDRAMSVVGTEFDRNNYLLNTPAGTFDLLTNTLRPHDSADMITACTAVAPGGEGGEVFNKFMHEITLGDRELIDFLQVALGACLSGAVESHWMMFWTGSGRNGKNTLGDLVMYILNDYARKVPTTTLMAKAHQEHPTEIANLRGARLATSSEVSDGDHWHEAKINELTGDETLTGRYMRGDYFQFQRTHKHLIYGNHRPQLRSVTDALKSRIKIVPFKASFVGREDPELPAKLRAVAGYVLQWLLEGHYKWLKTGRKLPACKAVEDESNDYFAAQSTIEAWMAERLNILSEDNRKVVDLPTSTTLYASYAAWKKDRGEGPVSQTRWAETMGKRFVKKTVSGRICYLGVELRSADFSCEMGGYDADF